MKEWLWQQIYHLNIIGDVLIVCITLTVAHKNTQKEIKTLKSEVKQDTARLKDELLNKV